LLVADTARTFSAVRGWSAEVGAPAVEVGNSGVSGRTAFTKLDITGKAISPRNVDVSRAGWYWARKIDGKNAKHTAINRDFCSLLAIRIRSTLWCFGDEMKMIDDGTRVIAAKKYIWTN
jgi:hypothetical protein